MKNYKESADKISLKIQLNLAKLDIIQLKYKEHGYYWSMLTPLGQAGLENMLLEIDSLLKQIES